MVSNTKLSREQKQAIKDFCANNHEIKFFDNGEITVMVKRDFPGSRMYAVSVATMAPNERKFRKSVGKYYAICNFENGQYVLMNFTTLEGFLDNALCIQTDKQCEDFADLTR